MGKEIVPIVSSVLKIPSIGWAPMSRVEKDRTIMTSELEDENGWDGKELLYHARQRWKRRARWT